MAEAILAVPAVAPLRLRMVPSAGYLLIAPNVLYLSVVLLAPLGMMVAYSLYAAGSPSVTLANYARLGDPYFLRLLLRTIWIAFRTALFCIVIGYPLAYFLARASHRIAAIGMLLLLTPLMVSPVVRAFGWMVLLDRNGLLVNVMRFIGFIGAQPLIYSEAAVIVGLVHLLLPYMVLPLTASIERIDPSLEEAARNLGASSRQLFTNVILPLSVPGLVSGATLVFVEALSAFVLPALIGGRRVRMVGNEVFDSLLVAYNAGQASTLTIAMIVLTIAAIGAGYGVTRRLRRTA